jgi:type II secretory pathway pseudopilin PulG
MGIFRDCELRIANCELQSAVRDRTRIDGELTETATLEDSGVPIRNLQRPKKGESPSDPQSAIRNSQSSTAPRNPQSGFTLAGLLVILSVIAVISAYLVPKMWSSIMWRERDLQTIFVMKQYAKAISDFQRTTGALPTSLEQLEKKTMPRVLRQTYANPLSGELDWILVPQGAVTPGAQPQGQGAGPGGQLGNQPPGTAQGPGTPVNQFGQPGGGDPRNYSGPFIGVRPPQTGESMIELFEQKQYEAWMYTINELEVERAARGAGPNPNQPPQGAGPR